MEEPAEFFKASSLDRVQQSSAEQTVETPDITLSEKIVEGLVTQAQQVVNASVQHVVDAVEVEKHIIHEKINQRFHRSFTDKVVDNPVVAQRRIHANRNVQKTIEISQLQITDKVIDVPGCVSGAGSTVASRDGDSQDPTVAGR